MFGLKEDLFEVFLALCYVSRTDLRRGLSRWQVRVEQLTNLRCQAEAATAVFQASKAWLRRIRCVLAVVR